MSCLIQYLVIEYCDKSLSDYIAEFKKKKKYIPLGQIKNISKQLLLALKFMHEKKIIHRDIKPENILLKNEKDLKICDFGCSTYLGKNEIFNPNIDTRNYKATELVLARNDYTQKIDILL
jgi:serine/threonine protein kinase